MKPKNRFTIYQYADENLGVIIDNTTGKQISVEDFDAIFEKEYGEFIRKKDDHTQKILETIISEIGLYNETCEPGFEITINDVINNLRKK